MVLLSTGSLSFIRENMKTPYDVAFVPRNVRNAVPIGGASLVMFAGQNEDSRKAGWKFIKWLSSTDTLGGWSRFTGYFAPRKSAYDKPEMKEFIAKNPDAKVALDQLPYAKPWFATYQPDRGRAQGAGGRDPGPDERQEEGRPGRQGCPEEGR
jgi:sn-glycerol 3-phosphate transport system substrate-binding protein